MLRGTAHGADCYNCPFSHDGRPSRPVYGIYPAQPAFIIVGEGPGRFEVVRQEPFVGPSGEVVNKILTRIRRPREEIGITNATLCLPTPDADEKMKTRAAEACKLRLQLELAQRPGIPLLTLGGVAARAVLPKAELDAIDPPEGRSKRSQKRNKAAEEAKEERKRLKKEAQIEKKHDFFRRKAHRELTKGLRDVVAKSIRQRGFKVTKHGLDMHVELEESALAPAIAARGDEMFGAWLIEKQAKEAARKAKKIKRPIKISDIASTLFHVDVDHSGLRYVIPAIHPAALLRGGGRAIAGTHTPDLAYINLTYDAAKVNSLAKGEDIELRFPIETAWAGEEIRDGQVFHLDAARQQASELVWRKYLDILETGVFALDLETYVENPEKHHALQAYVAKIRAIGLATGSGAVSVLWDLLYDWAKRLIAHLLASKTIRKIYHNGLYDRPVLLANGFQIAGPWDDTLLMHHVVFPGCAHGLQIVTAQFFACKPWKSEFRNALETPESLTTYNAKDTFATFQIWKQLAPLVLRTKTERAYANDLAKSEIFAEMHLNGIPMDPEENRILLEQFSAGVVESRRTVEEAVHRPEIWENVLHHLAWQQTKGKQRKSDPAELEERYNLRYQQLLDGIQSGKWHWKISAGKHIAALLEALGVKLTAVTKSGITSTQKDVLNSLVHIPEVRDILRYREDDKLLMTFVYPAFDRAGKDGSVYYGYADAQHRIHSIWGIHKITGRVASTEMPFGNVPKSKIKKMPDGSFKVIRPNLRRQVIAPRRRVFVEFDFAQLEARIIAYLSKDPFLVDVFASGKDIHTECARVVFAEFDSLGDGSGKLTKAQKQLRDNVKPLEYGAFYGGSPETLWKNLVKEGYKLTLEDVTAAVATLMRKMPGVVRWQRKTIETANTFPYEIREQKLGRRRTFPLGQADQNEAINFGVQAFASGLMDTGMIAMHKRLAKYHEAFEILQIHDAAVYECWEEDAVAILRDVEECYTQKEGEILYPIEATICYSWAGTSSAELEKRCRDIYNDRLAGYPEDQLAKRRQAVAAAANETIYDTDPTKSGSVRELFPDLPIEAVPAKVAQFVEAGRFKLSNEGKGAKLTAAGTLWLEHREAA